jgi:hypothetical protein
VHERRAEQSGEGASESRASRWNQETQRIRIRIGWWPTHRVLSQSAVVEWWTFKRPPHRWHASQRSAFYSRTNGLHAATVALPEDTPACVMQAALRAVVVHRCKQASTIPHRSWHLESGSCRKGHTGWQAAARRPC